MAVTRPNIRNIILRRAGVSVGRARILRGLSVTGRGLAIADEVFINVDCLVEASGAVDVERGVSIAMGVRLLTVTHEMGGSDGRAGEMVVAPIRIGAGTWVGAGATILPGVDIGAGCVVAAGAVVTRSVAANSLVAGVPARFVRTLL